jgi:hypothetical protein
VLRWLADENFNNDILRALFRGNPTIDVVGAQDFGPTGSDQPPVVTVLTKNRSYNIQRR